MATLYSFIIHANPFHHSQSYISIYHEKKYKRDNSPPPSQILLGPPLWDLLHVRKSQCDRRSAHALTYMHTQCAHTHTHARTRPSWAWRAHLAPNAPDTRGAGQPNHLGFGLFVAPGYKMNSSTNHQLSVFILCTPGHCLPGLYPLRRDHHRGFPGELSSKYYTAATWALDTF